MKEKTCEQSKTIMSELVIPNDTNLLGNLLGGQLMHWIDICGAMAASRHSGRVVATAALDSLNFRHPVKLGHMVKLEAKVIWCGRTSMKVYVSVYSENMQTGQSQKTNEAHITFVALDENAKPTPVPPLKPETPEEIALYEECERQYQAQKKSKK